LPRASVVPGQDSNALGAASATPVVESEGPVAHGSVCVALVHLGEADPSALPEVTTRAQDADLLVDIAWPNGARDTIRLPDPAADPAQDPWKDRPRA
ncbi:MAG: hypothetical protein QOI83_4637, partial [Streptomycetaceae bacterium]|nr:hypothetical protein [Streptomycetaceae bacterium]